MCGTAAWEWEDDPHAYEPISHTCRGCMVTEVAKDDAPNSPGTRIRLVTQGTARRLREAPKRVPTRSRR